jgi:hypothetical protein
MVSVESAPCRFIFTAETQSSTLSRSTLSSRPNGSDQREGAENIYFWSDFLKGKIRPTHLQAAKSIKPKAI